MTEEKKKNFDGGFRCPSCGYLDPAHFETGVCPGCGESVVYNKITGKLELVEDDE